MSTAAVDRLNAALSGRYRIERELGEGGMATVYLADDLKHERKVALKVLKPELAAVVGAERFLAEIKTTANLQHPHVLGLHDSGEADGMLFYVMPYVDGESLRERLDREHQLPVDEAVSVAVQVAEALDYAHRQGVIHRDIKPANILLQDGNAVVSDFGIALAVGAAGRGRLTETGLSLGTPHYMSPEQATGDLSVGGATDVYALGCVLYEMLVGEPPFTGSTAQAVLGKIIAGEHASVARQRSSVPANVDAAVRRSLEKVPADRFGDARALAQALGDRGFRYREQADGRVNEYGTAWRRSVVTFATATALLAGLAAWGWLRPLDAGAGDSVVSAIVGAAEPELGVGLGISPDGETVVYTAFQDDQRMLFRRPVGDLEASPIPGTEGGHDPTFSPNGEWLAFKVTNQLKKVRVDGGPVTVLMESGVAPNGGLTWGPDDNLYFPRCCPEIAISSIAAAGGDPEPITSAGPSEEHWAPDFLPDARFAVFTLWDDAGAHIAELSLDTREWQVISDEPALGPRFVHPDRLVYLRPDRFLMTVEFDPSTRTVSGSPVPITQVDLRDNNVASPQFRTSASGALVYFPPVESAAVLLSRGAEPVQISADVGAFSQPALSADLRRAVFILGLDLWVYELDRGFGSQVTRDELVWHAGLWSPDGRTLVYSALGEGIVSRSIDGTDRREVLIESDGPLVSKQFVSGGTSLLIHEEDTLRVLDLQRREYRDRGVSLVGTRDWDRSSLSPDGNWLAVGVSRNPNDSFQRDVWVQPFPGPGARLRVSEGNAHNPFWSADGSLLFYRETEEDGSVSLRAATVETVPELSVVTDEVVWSGMIPARSRISGLDVAVYPDGDRALVVQRLAPHDVVLIQNWREWLQRRTGGGG